jgi:hypothetical protein
LKFDIKKFYEHPHVRHTEWNDLVLFCYTRECQYDGHWDEITMNARGIIFNKITGEVISRPFQKFFNASELMGKVDLIELAKKPFVALKKIDGSLGIYFRYEDQDYISTKGSFSSEQAQWATKWFREHIGSAEMLKGHTYLFEMIYPENKIVIDYGDTEDLILLSIINNETGEEIPYSSLKEEGRRIGATVVEMVEFSSLDELYAYCKTLPATEEGFVLTFHNDLKVKVKGSEYCKIHRILSHMTPLAFWDAWDFDKADISRSFLAEVPEEFRELTDLLYWQIYGIHHNEYFKVRGAYMEVMRGLPVGTDHKTLFFKATEQYHDLVSDLMYYHKGNHLKLWKGIHRRVRPKFNILPDSVTGSARLKRILEEN